MLMKQSEEKKVKQVPKRNNNNILFKKPFIFKKVVFITNFILYLNRKEVRL